MNNKKDHYEIRLQPLPEEVSATFTGVSIALLGIIFVLLELNATQAFLRDNIFLRITIDALSHFCVFSAFSLIVSCFCSVTYRWIRSNDLIKISIFTFFTGLCSIGFILLFLLLITIITKSFIETITPFS